MSASPSTDASPDPLLERLVDENVPRDDVSERILKGALRQIEDFGVRRFTVDDLAKRLRISRVTIYRRFDKKSDLLEAALFHELNRVLLEINTRVERCQTLEERLIEGFVSVLVIVRGHGLLNRMLQTEPELILPVLTVRGSPVLAASREFIASFARREAEQSGVSFDEDQLKVLSEMLARTVLSFVLTPESAINLETPDRARLFAKRYLAPVLRMMASSESEQSANQGE